MTDHLPITAIIAGRGGFVQKCIDTCNRQKIPFVVVFLSDFFEVPHAMASCVMPLTRVGSILSFLKAHQVQDVVLVGSLARPSFRSLSFDALGMRWMKRLGARLFQGDDALLRGVIELLEEEGFYVRSSLDYSLPTRFKEGALKPTTLDIDSIERAKSLLKTLSPFDVGQALVIQQGVILGIEAFEGTQSLIQRCHTYRLEGRGPILVKCAKLKQSLKVDIPSLGPDTFHLLKELNYAGIAFEVLTCQILDGDTCFDTASQGSLFIYEF